MPSLTQETLSRIFSSATLITANVSRSFAGIKANTVAGLRQTSTNLFAQDDFRVLPNLTLNVGLRWEYNAPTTDKYNHLATFDPNFPNSTPLPYLRVSTPQTPNIYNSSKKEFSPRFGFAYTPFGPKTVFRGGYGVFWDVKILNVILNSESDRALPHRLHIQPEHQRHPQYQPC